jgi:threonine dehydratase
MTPCRADSACYDTGMTTAVPTLPAFADVLSAAARIAPHVQQTPVLRSQSLDDIAGCRLHFKCENLQRVGAFKFRGACNAIFALDDVAASRGILTQSSGNHGAAVALASRLRGTPATVVVPEGAPAVKLAAIAVRCAPKVVAHNAAAAALAEDTGAHLVHPFDDAHVIAGQGTVALEFLRSEPQLDALLTPVGGGGLLSGCALAARTLRPELEILGAEPAGAADAHASLREGRCITDMVPNTICDGLRGQLAPRTLALLRRHIDGILIVDDSAVIEAMRLLWERLKLVVEPSGAIALAAVLRNRERFAGRRVGIVISGGNVDLETLPWQAHAT